MSTKNVGEITLKEILQKQFGDDSLLILDEINQAYQKGVQEEDLQKLVNDALTAAGKESYKLTLSVTIAGG